MMIRKLLIMNVSIFLMVFAASTMGLIGIKNSMPAGPADGNEGKVLASRKDRERFVAPVVKLTKFEDNFNLTKTIEEAGSMKSSRDTNWWLNSGAYINAKDGIGATVIGELTAVNKWRMAYYLSNPEDTDDGYHPQNIFRLVTKSSWLNFTQQVYFNVSKDNLSNSPQRNESNGLLLFNRYQDGQTLYYTGLRVDGALVIKKKLIGEYFTMAYKKYFPGTYDKNSSPNLIPKNTWIGLKSEVKTTTDGKVNIKVYLDLDRKNDWKLVLEATDEKGKFGSQLILNRGFAGIRTDFMDVLFDDYVIEEK